MNSKKSLIVSIGLGLTILSLGEVTLAQSDEPPGGTNSTLTGGTPTGQNLSTPLTGGSSGTTNTRRFITDFTGQTVSGANVSIPQDVVNLINGRDTITEINTNSGNFDTGTVFGTDSPVGDNISSGSNSSNSTTGENIATGTNSTETSTGAKKSPGQIVVCLTDSCASSDIGSGNIISVNDLAKLIADDLNKSLNDLVAAENAESSGEVMVGEAADQADNPRRIARAESSNDRNQITRRDSLDHEDCGCVPGERKIVREPLTPDNSKIGHNVKTVAEAREIVKTKLEESSDFIEQINQLKPEYSLW